MSTEPAQIVYEIQVYRHHKNGMVDHWDADDEVTLAEAYRRAHEMVEAHYQMQEDAYCEARAGQWIEWHEPEFDFSVKVFYTVVKDGKEIYRAETTGTAILHAA